jgi:DNA polymerase
LIEGLNKGRLIDELINALRFYKELGFEYLPISNDLASRLIAVFSGSEKSSLLNALRKEIANCTKCKLSKGRTHLVFGEGNPRAKLMFIGEAPGHEEDLQGRPFVGDAGRLLTSLIEKMGFQREDVFIANVVKCRPPMNRDPEEDEIEACMPYLIRQVDIIMPRVIMTLGRIATQAITGQKIPITKLRGKIFEFRGIKVVPTYHPAYLLRNRQDKWATWSDAQKVLKILEKN